MRKLTIALIGVLSMGMLITASVFQSNQKNDVFNANIEALTEDGDEPEGGSGGGRRGSHSQFCGYTYVTWNGQLVTCNNIVVVCDYIHNNDCEPIPCSSLHY